MFRAVVFPGARMTWLDALLSLLTIGGVLAIAWASTVWPEVRDVEGEE
jgi:hypothetical protein